ncbi:hypothetical protein [Paraburkholderia sp. ZP32-5]|uniref:hypothetical protein n=1 Tax=Paraburkholderia sp. ZP32-5 TaxID=2883245 RepID=UPI001F2BEC83|nr:hypothetical protein [Paraburkholderia sp. ZP32-5]
MTRLFSTAACGKSLGTYAIAGIAGLALVVLCATGIAAFAGLLPESEHVAAAMTAAPIIDVQVDDRHNDSNAEPNARVEPRLNAQAWGPRRMSRERLRRAVIVA